VNIVAGIIKDAGDQKTRQNKEDVDACPAPWNGVIVLEKARRKAMARRPSSAG
jgi:hypothetical protein